ncbi:hypothetical protein EON65_37560, partial [archaeon]
MHIDIHTLPPNTYTHIYTHTLTTISPPQPPHPLQGAFHDSGSIGVILEFMDRGSLEFLMQSSI